jgi:hypothetical protein
MKRILVVLCWVSLIGFYSCKTDKKVTKTTKKDRVIAKKTDAEVKTEMDELLREMEATWNEMIASDDQKIDNLQTLLARIGRDKKYDKKALSEVISARDNLKGKRYDRLGISNVAAVDSYDSAQIRILDVTNELTSASNLTSRDSIAAEISNKIQEDDSRVPILRAHYDKAANNYNQYLKDYQPQIQKLGAPYKDLKPVPLFVEQQLQ